MSCAKGNVRCNSDAFRVSETGSEQIEKAPLCYAVVRRQSHSLVDAAGAGVGVGEDERSSRLPARHAPFAVGLRVAARIGQLHAAEHARELSPPGTHVTNVSQRAQIRPSPTHQHRSSSALRQPNRFTGPSSIEGQPALFFIGHISPIFARFVSVFSRFSPAVL